MDIWNTIDRAISTACGTPFQAQQRLALGGGCINHSYKLSTGHQHFFVKLNAAAKLEMFIAEAEGLQALADSATIRVPTVICYGIANDQAYLALEYLPLTARGDQAQLGQALARLHRCTGPRYGWHRSNTIGATPQYNTYADSWLDFWREQRLGFQLALAAENGFRGSLQAKGRELLNGLDLLLGTHQPAPSLVHGDLWSGNYAFTTEGSPVIFDPAVHYGDRETDLAMTELFGGFSNEFYRAYQAEYPLPAGYETRKILYNLYHVLNHLHLFGGGYLRQAETMIDELLR
ncbi:MAG: fructosamine kinase family protein [Gammaproteobacteria bacterium]|nr:fructosamine kinase family protein [Gammaproteobacteria bacterium]